MDGWWLVGRYVLLVVVAIGLIYYLVIYRSPYRQRQRMRCHHCGKGPKEGVMVYQYAMTKLWYCNDHHPERIMERLFSKEKLRVPTRPVVKRRSDDPPELG